MTEHVDRLPASEGSGTTPEFHGSVDFAQSGFVSGWVVDRSAPTRVLDLAIELDGHLVATCTTGGTRTDVEVRFPKSMPGFVAKWAVGEETAATSDEDVLTLRILEASSRVVVLAHRVDATTWKSHFLGGIEEVDA